jgi:hypothetical protein
LSGGYCANHATPRWSQLSKWGRAGPSGVNVMGCHARSLSIRGACPYGVSKNAHTVPQRDHSSRADFRLRRYYTALPIGAPACYHGHHGGLRQRWKRRENGLEGKSEMAEEPSGDSDTSRNTKRRAPNTPVNQQADAPDLATERDALWDTSALSPADSVPETSFSSGVRAALDQIFPAEQSHLGRVAERSAVYGAGATDSAGATDGAGA